jgi:dihydroxy-acid dehydratase
MDLKHRSRGITDGRDRAGARSMFKAIGFTDADLCKPLIGVANTWIETMPCNFHLRRLSAKVKEGIRDAGGTPMEFNTIAISDGETMGTEGMKASLVSREVIADSIELVCRGQLFDAAVCVVGCDKTIPAAAMALARMNLPGLVLYGGTILAGKYKGKDVTIQDVFEAVGANAAGKMSDADLLALENVACPGAGACGGQYTANTMSTVMELIGLSPMGFNGIPAMDPRKDEVAFRCGEVVMNCLKKGIRPRGI